jgi:GNAT superfamily N-acetyltransferase
VNIRPGCASDRAWIDELVSERWVTPTVVSRGRVHRPSELPCFLASEEGKRVGLLTYSIDGDACEIVTIDSLVEGKGVGTALLEAVTDAAREEGCRRLWLVTTNDNLPALGFYERRGFSVAAVHRDAVTTARRLKPEIPLAGLGGVRIRDELELELEL